MDKGEVPFDLNSSSTDWALGRGRLGLKQLAKFSTQMHGSEHGTPQSSAWMGKTTLVCSVLSYLSLWNESVTRGRVGEKPGNEVGVTPPAALTRGKLA